MVVLPLNENPVTRCIYLELFGLKALGYHVGMIWHKDRLSFAVRFRQHVDRGNAGTAECNLGWGQVLCPVSCGVDGHAGPGGCVMAMPDISHVVGEVRPVSLAALAKLELAT
jgi:hypothetical protein